MRVKIYVEGGGDSKALKIGCRKGFRELLEKAGFLRRMPVIVACGGRGAAYDDFRTALSSTAPDEYPILLVDSESPVAVGAWEHLNDRDGWGRPTGADNEQAQLMVQCMEAWFLADRDALKQFFGQDLRENALSDNPDIETIPKDDVLDALAAATRDCGKARKYRKGKRSFELLGRLDAEKLKQELPHFMSLCRVLEAKI